MKCAKCRGIGKFWTRSGETVPCETCGGSGLLTNRLSAIRRAITYHQKRINKLEQALYQLEHIDE